MQLSISPSSPVYCNLLLHSSAFLPGIGSWLVVILAYLLVRNFLCWGFKNSPFFFFFLPSPAFPSSWLGLECPTRGKAQTAAPLLGGTKKEMGTWVCGVLKRGNNAAAPADVFESTSVADVVLCSLRLLYSLPLCSWIYIIRLHCPLVFLWLSMLVIVVSSSWSLHWPVCLGCRYNDGVRLEGRIRGVFSVLKLRRRRLCSEF